MVKMFSPIVPDERKGATITFTLSNDIVFVWHVVAKNPRQVIDDLEEQMALWPQTKMHVARRELSEGMTAMGYEALKLVAESGALDEEAVPIRIEIPRKNVLEIPEA